MRISGITYAARKTHRARGIVKAVIVLLIVAILAVVVISGYKSWILLHPEIKSIDTFSANIVPEYRDISFRGSDSSIVLKGWLFQANKSDRGIILVHSYGKNRLQFGIKTIDMIKEFISKGYNVFTFDLRNSGESDGKSTTFGSSEKDDILAAVNYMASQGSKRITLIGFSTGASASMLAAGESDSVHAVIADSPYADLETYLSENLNKWTNLPSFPFNKAVALSMRFLGGVDTENSSPVNILTTEKPSHMLLIHARNDDLIPIENSIELYQKYSALNPSGADFWWIDGNGNAAGYEKQPAEYMKKVFEFLDNAYRED